MNTKLRKETKNDFEKDFFKLVNNSVMMIRDYKHLIGFQYTHTEAK